MGLVQSHTLLKLDDYMLICAPYQLSMKQAVLLVILSREEASFFQQFQKKITSLSLSFQVPGNRNPVNFFIRGTLERIGPVKGRDNVCIAEVLLKNCPNDLVEILGDYIVAYESLKSQFENFKDRYVDIDEKSARTLRFNNFVETQVGGQKVQTQLLSLAVNRLVLGIPDSVQGLQVDQNILHKLYFQTYQFVVSGKATDIQVSGQGFRKVTCEISFAPELVEILDDYFFRLSFKK